MAEKKLEVKNLTISFKTDNGLVQAVRNVSFDLDEEETLCIVGESGSGKSVTSKAIMGILANNAVVEGGEILYEGENLLEVSEEEYHTIVSTMNQYKEELSTHYDSRQFIADVSELSDLHKVEIGDILKKTIKDVKGKAFTKSKFRENFIKNLR